MWAPAPGLLLRGLLVLRRAGPRGLASGGAPRDPGLERALRIRRRRRKSASACGAPVEARTLSRQAMEQMRFLGRERPSEEGWPVWRLAQGFGVSREVVLRVLRSRFVPSAERAAKQDASAARSPFARSPGGGGRGRALPSAKEAPQSRTELEPLSKGREQ